MFVIDFICEKYVLLIEIIGLAVVMVASVHIPRRIVKWTTAALVMLLLDAVMIRAEIYTQSFETLSPWRVILSVAIYLIQPLMIIFLTQITAPMKKSQWWLTLPWFISIPMYTSSQFNHLIIFFTADNHWQGGPFSLYRYILFAFYVGVFLVLNLLNFRKAYRSERIGIIYIVLSGLAGVALMAVFGSGDSDYSDILAAEIVLYYLFLYIHAANIDQLTGLLTRQCFFRDLESHSGSVQAVASVDMNELKWINDNQGHAAGDVALQAVANALTADSGIRKSVYRVGGDEFEIFYYTGNMKKVEKDVAFMREKLAEAGYSCAFGCLKRSRGDKLDALIKAADKAMYEDKARMKQEIIDSGGVPHFRSGDRAVGPDGEYFTG